MSTKKYNNIMNQLLVFKSTDQFLELINKNNFYNLISENDKYFLNIKNNIGFEGSVIRERFLLSEQERLEEVIESNKGVLSITAPTSFGKTHIIIKHILQKNKKALIISPTLSLCTEYFMNMNYHYKKYGVNNKPSVSMSPLIDANVYILTPEKAKILITQKNFSPDISIFDEFYEAFSSERHFAFYDTYDWAKKTSRSVILIFPKSVKFPSKISVNNSFNTQISQTTRIFTKYLYDPKDNKTFKLKYSEYSGAESVGRLIETIDEKIDIFTVIKKWGKKLYTRKKIIVLDSKPKMYSGLEKMMEFYPKIMPGPITKELIKYLKLVSPNILLLKSLSHGIAYHNGDVDKFVRTLIEEAYKKGELNLLYANSTITKGININPDILIINSFSFLSKMDDGIKEIELNNAIGRVGRTIMRKNLIGNVVIFTKQKAKYALMDKVSKRDFTETINIKNKVIEVPEDIDSAEKAYKLILLEKIMITISKEEAKILIIWLKPSINEETRSGSYKKLIDLVHKKFNIVYKNEWLKNEKYFLYISYLLKQGYSRNYNRKRNSLLRDESLYLNNNGWITKQKTSSSKKFIAGTKSEDILLGKCVSDYERDAGYYFTMLLSKILDTAIINKMIPQEIIDEYNSRKVEEEEINTLNGWPESFSTVFISKVINKENLNVIMKKILEKL